MFKKLINPTKCLVSSCLLLVSSFIHAAIIAIEVEELDFNKFLPLIGDCEMAYDTGVITSIFATNMCNNAPVGTPGEYVLNNMIPNTNYDIKVHTRLPVSNDGFTFSPRGKIISDAETLNIVADQFVRINSGTLGQVTIKMGGRIKVAKPTSGGTKYNLEDAVKITYQVAP